MRKTIVQWTSRVGISHKDVFGHYSVPSRMAGIVCLFLLTLFGYNPVQAQGPYCPSFNCTANDVQLPSYFLGDVNGTPLTTITCTPGESVTNVYLWITFTVTATNRYDINVIGDVLLDNAYNHTFNVCLGDFSSGTYTRVLEQIVWECGAEMKVANTLFSWAVNNNGSCQTCPDQSSKCYRASTLTVATPLVADFSYTTACVTGQSFEVFTFTNQTTGGVTPYSNYVWNFGAGATPTPSTISGPAASGPFTVTYSSAGARTVTLTVTDANGTISTRSYTINVAQAAGVTITVDDATICSGGTALLTANVISGSVTSYQWQQLAGGVWSNIGTNQNTYTTPPLLAGSYTYRVIGNPGSSCQAVSPNSVVTVVADPTVGVTASDLSICDGGTTTFTATVSGGNGTSNYQWQFNNAGTWVNVGSNLNTYTTPVLSTGTYTYRVLVTQDAGCFIASTNQVVTVVADPLVNVSVANPSICVGGSTTLTANVTGGNGTTVYQWQSFNGSTWSVVGSNQNTYTTPVLNTPGTFTYRVQVTQDPGCAVISSNATVTVIADLLVTTQPANITECVGGNLTMSVAVSGGSGTISYLWQQSPDGTSGWANATGTGSTTSTFTPPSTVAGTTYYRVIITASNPGCGQAISNVASATITPDISVTSQPSNITECVGGNATMTVTITGGSGTIAYQWQSSADGSAGWTNATGTGATTATYTPSSTTPGTTYYRVLINASNNGCGEAISNVATATIQPDLTITTQPANVNECVGGTNTMTVNVSGSAGTNTYQWQSSPDGTSGWVNATGTGATTATFTPPSIVPGTTYYRVLINTSGSGCDQVISNTATAVIAPDFTVTTQPSNVNECIGGTNTMTVVVTGGSGTITYQWQSSGDGTTGWSNAVGSGSTTSTFTPPSVVAGTTYYRVLINATNSGCGQAISNVATAIISPDLVITTQPSDVYECVGGNGTMSVVVSGGVTPLTYQWQSSADGSTGWANAAGAGATTSSFTPPSAVPGTTFYRVLISSAGSGCDQVVSNTSVAVISGELVITSQPNNILECIGGITTTTVTVTGGSGNFTYQWQSSADGSTGWTNATSSGATTATFTPPSTMAGTTYYRVVVSVPNSGCASVISNVATVIVTEDLQITAHPNNVFECIGGANVMSIVVSGGTGIVTYQWQQSADGITGWIDITGETNDVFTPPSTSPGTSYYRVIVTPN